jgi:hypothetical protein
LSPRSEAPPASEVGPAALAPSGVPNLERGGRSSRPSSPAPSSPAPSLPALITGDQ